LGISYFSGLDRTTTEAKTRSREAEIVNDIRRESFSVMSHIYQEWLSFFLSEVKLAVERLLKKAPQLRGFFIVLL